MDWKTQYIELHSMSDYHAAECGLTSRNNCSKTSDLAEVNSFHEDYWYLDELFNEQLNL